MFTDENFQLLDLLGIGNFAQTWLARVIDPVLIDEWETEEVALKIPLNREKEIVLKKELELNAGLFLQIQNVEAENIVKYLGFDIFEGRIVMVMSYVAGGNLRQIMGGYRYPKTLDYQQALHIAKGALEGLSVIQKYNIVHRDIKPENILMDGDTPKISDLGIGRMLKRNELALSNVGTLFYLSPEILFEKDQGAGASFNTDIWSFGVMFFEMLCNQLPFDIHTDMPQGEIVRIIDDSSIPLLFPKEAKVPSKLQVVMQKALQRDPSRRYQNADEVLQDLTELSKAKSEREERIDREVTSVLCRFPYPSQTEMVEKILKEIIKNHPDLSCVYHRIGEFYNRCGSFNKAINMFEKGIELDSNNALLHWGLAIACLENGDKSVAQKMIMQALDLGLETSLERYAKLLLTKLQGKGIMKNA